MTIRFGIGRYPRGRLAAVVLTACLLTRLSGQTPTWQAGANTIYVNPTSTNVGIGTQVPQYKLAVNGTIGAKEVIVSNTGWPDFVFKAGYRLKPLSEVDAYIQEHRHLPDVPSEQDVHNNGVSLGEMQATLLAKIEELTLHMIEAAQRSDRLERQNHMLQNRIRELEQRVGRAAKP